MDHVELAIAHCERIARQAPEKDLHRQGVELIGSILHVSVENDMQRIKAYGRNCCPNSTHSAARYVS